MTSPQEIPVTDFDRTRLPQSGVRPSFDPEIDLRDQTDPLPGRPRLEAPTGAPNVLVVLIDDMGFGASSAFGGPCRMPTADALADGGLRYSRFHTTALCSPTRQSLMTGRNHHAVGMGTVLEITNGTPGYDGMRPATAGTLAQALSGNGYATAAFGKWHQTPPWEQTAAGPFDRWPTREGFDHFYGFLAAEASQFEPLLVDDTTFVDPPSTEAEGYHLSEDLVDRLGDWVADVRTHDADKPWFGYLAFGATHAPFQVPTDWRDRNRGDFAHGWDAQRDLTLAKQKALGVVPEDAELAPWTPGIPHWDDLDEVQREVAERLMELYASFAEHTDEQVGRLVERLREAGELDNTVILYILGDNGASAEGGLEGTLNETLRFNAVEDTAERIATQLDKLGGPETYAHYPAGWAVALDTPYQWTKQVASHYGGTRNGLIVHWPDGVEQPGGIRHQWHHVNDVFPTVLELAGVPVPTSINGVTQDPLDGVSFAPTIAAADAPETHHTQYFEMFGNRGIYHEGWTAVTQHKAPWLIHHPDTRMADDVWELYDTTTDWTQARDIAAEHPEKLAELQELFLLEARRNHVLPMDDGVIGKRMDADAAGRRQSPLTSIVLPARARNLREDVVPNVKNASHVIRARIEVPDTGADGVLVAQGGGFGGWSVYVLDGHLTYAYNFGALEVTHVRADVPLKPGAHVVEVRSTYDGGGLGKGAAITLVVDGEDVGSGRLERTIPFFFSMDQALNVGIDRGTPVSPDYARTATATATRGFAFTGRIHDVRIDVGPDALTASTDELFGAVLVAH